MMPLNQKLTLALGIVLTIAMSQASDAQLFRSRRCPCPAPAVNYCCPQQEVTTATPVTSFPVPQYTVQSATISNLATPVINTPLNSTEIAPLPVVLYSPTELSISSPVENQPVFETTPTVSTTVDTNATLELSSSAEPNASAEPTASAEPNASAEPEIVIYESASDIPVADSTTSVVVPTAGSEDNMLTAPAPTPAPVQAPIPVATGDTVILTNASQPTETPETQNADLLEPKAVEKAKEIERSILTDQ